jgi:hypothetical protein
VHQKEGAFINSHWRKKYLQREEDMVNINNERDTNNKRCKK